MELQVQLNQSEAKLKQMQKGMSSGGYVSNGPSAEPEHGSGGISPSEWSVLNICTCLLPYLIFLFLSLHSVPLFLSTSSVLERETLNIQIPKGNDARKKGWKDMVCFSTTTSD